MKESIIIVLASGVTSTLVSSILGSFAGYVSASRQLEMQLHLKHAEAGYEALVKADKLLWRADELQADPRKKDEVAQMRRESDDNYFVARFNIAAFGDERVVKALSDYYLAYGIAARPCEPREKFALDTKIYTALRGTMGVGGDVSDSQIANVVFNCSLK
jgi:hypothetical protein